MNCRCNYNCDCVETGDAVRLKGGTDIYEVTGHAKTQPKAIIEVDGESVYVPYSCLEKVKKLDPNEQLLANITEDLGNIIKTAQRERFSSKAWVNVNQIHHLYKKLIRR